MVKSRTMQTATDVIIIKLWVIALDLDVVKLVAYHNLENNWKFSEHMSANKLQFHSSDTDTLWLLIIDILVLFANRTRSQAVTRIADCTASASQQTI